MKLHTLGLTFALATTANFALAEMTISMSLVDASGTGSRVGEITVTESEYGLVFTPNLTGLSSGLHGFHVHENPSCEPAEREGKMVAAAAAGGHYDPENTGRHGMPWGDGHLGDLPALYVDENGSAKHPVLAPRLKMADLEGRSLMIHQGGDNYADEPAPLGGGGARVACGVVGQ